MMFRAFFTLIAVASAAMCDNDADSAIWNKDGRDNFDDYMESCGKQCWGASSCVSECVQKREAFSDGCAKCFGDCAQCTRDHCMLPCMNGKTPACIKCNHEHCSPALDTCTGYSDIPPTAAGLDDEEKILYI